MRTNKPLPRIGWLELLLSLAVIAIIVLLVGRYNLSTRQAQHVKTAVSIINASFSAGNSWVETKGMWKNNMVAEFVDHGLLPDDFAKTNPWGGTIQIIKVPADTGTDFKVILTQVPKKACQNLRVTFETLLDKKVKLDHCTRTNLFGITYIEFPQRTK